MAGDTNNPRIWEGADVYTAELGATAPDDTTTAWDADWDALGLISEDGLTESREDDLTDHWAYGNILVRTTRSRHKRTFTVTPLEDTPVVFDLVNPGSETETTGGVTTRTVKLPTTDIRAFGLELRDGDLVKRIVIPRGEVTDTGDRPITDDEMQSVELTIAVYPDGDGILYYEITDDPQAESGS